MFTKSAFFFVTGWIRTTGVFVSPDRDFLASLATCVLEIKEGRATFYPCDYEQYRWRIEQDLKEARAKSAPAPSPPAAPAAQAKQKRSKAHKAKRNKIFEDILTAMGGPPTAAEEAGSS